MSGDVLLELEQDASTSTTLQADRVTGWISRSTTRGRNCTRARGPNLRDGHPRKRRTITPWSWTSICDTDVVAEQLEAAIQKRFGAEDAVIVKDETLVVKVYVKTADTVLSKDFDGSRRITVGRVH
jgi:hypothetical protein